MAHVIEHASTARSKCRGCGERIAQGALRFGERLPNPFAEGETTHWFHLDCAAYKRPGPFIEALDARSEALEDGERLRAEATAGIERRRLPRISGAERAASGRAACRSCKALIEKGAWRIALVFYEEGRFSPAGYVHVPCARAYFETTELLPRLRRFSPTLADADVRELASLLEVPDRA